MPRTVCYALNRGTDEPLTYGQLVDLENLVNSATAVQPKSKRKGKRSPQSGKGDKKMSPSENGQGQVKGTDITRQVFDLTRFDTVDLVKEFYLPQKPKDVKEALEMVGGKQEVLVDIIYKGMVQDKRQAEYDDISGYKVLDEEGKPTEEYHGKFATSEKKLLINAAVLNIAKLQGYHKDMTQEQKDAAREKAMRFIRDNPAMIESIQG